MRLISISRRSGVVRGLDFYFPSFSWFSGPVHEGTPAKLSSRYTVPNANGAPVDLVAYYDHLQPPMPGWEPRLRSYLEGHLPTSAFDRIWVYNHRSGRLLQQLP